MNKSIYLNELIEKELQRSQKEEKMSFEIADSSLRSRIFPANYYTRSNTAKTPDIKKNLKKNQFTRQWEKENLIIQKENITINKKITSAKGSLSVKKWNKDFKKSREYLIMRSKKSLSKTPKKGFRLVTHRPLIDALDTCFAGKKFIPSIYNQAMSNSFMTSETRYLPVI
ncbi:hypothetical protein SteCoe_17618 [Stentor coeruleus]|uniref:Uncharacterized protein n=1 Tax=Stentor coeruleus TaxID=5963 RepID=A0A1R2BYH9_9CILI|nr:hypothetical protein SteCoe_17618 [Stentor coeruleus]